MARGYGKDYNASMANGFAEALLGWFEKHGRDLPWRRKRDPYSIWISEMMLQQTRVETVLDYFERWKTHFPDIHSLAQSDIGQVLLLWEGLGYYQRAHNLHKAARIIVKTHAGEFPKDPKTLVALPGIGPYTAAAVASIAFNQDQIALDGNLRRVLSRIFDYDQDPRSSEGEAYLKKEALRRMPSGLASSFNQALMDLGSMVCLPRKPACAQCPVRAYCLAYERGVQEQRPLRKIRKPIPHHDIAAGIAIRGGKAFIARRPEGELLGGLWEFPGGKCELGESLPSCLEREWWEEFRVEVSAGDKLGVFEHAYTHFRITVHAFKCGILQGEPEALEHAEICWVRVRNLKDYPMGKVDREIAKTLMERHHF